MRCSACGFDNPEGMNFCGRCGTKLSNPCPHCGFENPPAFQFCGKCGVSLTAQPLAPKPPDSELRTPNSELISAERRQLTVMFCDLVGSTALSAQLDPEELRVIVQAYQAACAAVIERYEGHIAQYLGDGLLVYFGYPLAHEDDAQRAVRAGLGIVGAIHELPLPRNARLQQPLQVRIGVHTGLVVVGEIGGGAKREQLALGETPNIAARLQGLAQADTVVLSSTTYRLIEGYFACQSLGSHSLKGLSQPMALYQVLHESGARSRLEVAATTGLTPLVGREQEVGLLLERWERVKEGAGQVVLLSGEAGIGKSRLVQVLKERAAGQPHTWLECRCSPYYQNSALYPVIDLLEQVLEFRRNEFPQEKLNKLERTLESYGLPLQEMVPLFAALLSLPLLDRYPLFTLTPRRQKEKTQQALLAWLLAEAERQPVSFIVEDPHWADPSTLEFLSLLVDQGPTARILTVLAFRPEFVPSWTPRSHVTQITLSRLPHKEVEVIVEKVAGGKVLPAEVLQQIVLKTDGVPLFVEELTKMVVESGLYVGATRASPLPPLAIPATLQDSLMARLDRLAPVKEVAQLGATLGREFSYELIQAVSPLDEETLQQGLAQLVRAELVYQRGLPPQAQYIFKHALIQDAAYQSLLKSKRQRYHNKIAQVLEERFPETKETQPELLAHHYTEAGLIAQAIPYWQQAGQRAIQRSAALEAIGHLTKGLEVLKTLPDTPERAQRELTLQIALGGQLMATRGYTVPEVEHAYARARELCRQVGETPELFPVLWGLVAFYQVRGESQPANELGKQMLRLAQSVQDPALLLMAHRVRGATLFWRELAPALEHLEQGIALYDRQQHHSLAFRYVTDPGVQCLGYAAGTLWHLGYPEQALRRIHEALTLAQELSHPTTLACALDWAAQLHRLRWEVQATQERAEALMTLCTEQGLPYFLAEGTMCRGWALVEQGRGEEGIAQIRQGLTTYRTTGAEALRPYFLALLAKAYGQVGQPEEGLTVLAEALTTIHKTGHKTGEYWMEAELDRLKGELSLKSRQVKTSPEQVKTSPEQVKTSPEQVKTGQGKSEVADPRPLTPDPQAEAEECFQKAIDIARRHSAKSLELQAVMSLSRLWQQQGKKEDARRMLAEIYDWFTEGFDTADLKEAKALLDELS